VDVNVDGKGREGGKEEERNRISCKIGLIIDYV
jgi:hypothetical protein